MTAEIEPGYVLLLVEETEACVDCEATFSREELHAFDSDDNDHCPGCGARGTMTTYYGEPEQRIQECALGIPESSDRARKMLAQARREGAEVMRERAAAWLDSAAASHDDAQSLTRWALQTAARCIRALPTDTSEESGR